MKETDLHKIIDRLLKLPKECEWAEFKLNFHSEDEIGKYISALSNGACLQNESYGYLVFGIENNKLQPVGTTFHLIMYKVGNEELENWLLQRLSPRLGVSIYETVYHDKLLSVFQIQAAYGQPVCFSHRDFIRVGSITRSLKDFPEKEKKIWTKGPRQIFEKGIALNVQSSEEIISLLDTPCYFDLLKIPYPSNRDLVVEKFISEKFIKLTPTGFAITNLGALLFAKDIGNFDSVKRKAVRVIQYAGKDKLKTIKEHEGKYG